MSETIPSRQDRLHLAEELIVAKNIHYLLALILTDSEFQISRSVDFIVRKCMKRRKRKVGKLQSPISGKVKNVVKRVT